MARQISRMVLNFVDDKGYVARFRFFADYDTPADGVTLLGAVSNALDALTNALSNGGTGIGTVPWDPGSYGTTAVFADSVDKAIMVFTDVKGNIHRYQVPAPKSTIFLTDLMTVDVANADVITFTNAMITGTAGPSFVCSRDGDQLAEFVGGLRVRRKNPRKVNIFIRAADLSGPAE